MTETEEQSREEQIEEIAEAVDEERQEDTEAQDFDEEPEPKDTVYEFQESEKVELETQPMEEETDDLDLDADDSDIDDLVDITVDGEKRQVSSSKIWDAGLRTLQKEAAADKRLEEASAKRKEAERILSEAKGQAEAAKPSEEQLAVMREVHEKFQTHYPTLADDPRLTSLVILDADSRLAQGAENTWQTYKDAAESIKTWHQGNMKKVEVRQQFQQKLEKKKRVDTPSGLNMKTKTTKIEPPEEKPSDIIKQMREARHQPT